MELGITKSVMEIQLGHGKVAVVDEDDFGLVSAHKWHLFRRRKTVYAIASVKLADGKWTTLYMHRLIMGARLGFQIDHIDGDGLNNRKANLRFATSSQNNQNRRPIRRAQSGYKGVYWNNNQGKWYTQICINRKKIHLGYFSNKEEAARSYDESARRYFGKYARTNF